MFGLGALGGANCFFLVFAFQIPFLLAGGGGGSDRFRWERGEFEGACRHDFHRFKGNMFGHSCS